MFIVSSYLLAVLMCLATMLCWGSWANTQKLATKGWKFQLFYWDYSIGLVIFSLLLALTAGSMGQKGMPFIDNLRQADSGMLGSAFIGGVVFNLSNILLVAAIEISGMSVAFPVGVGLALVIGVISNYLKSPLGNPVLLFIGVGFVIVAILLDSMAYKSLGSGKNSSPLKGIVISVVAGILMGFFYRFVADSMSSDFEVIQQGKLTPYSAVVIFSLGVLLSNFIWNTIVMIKPFSGEPATYREYLTGGSFSQHLTGILGGIIWNAGMSLSIIASGIAGYAISYGLGQGATMVAAVWGVFIWKEFSGGNKKTYRLLTFMFVFYILGLSLIIAARIM